MFNRCRRIICKRSKYSGKSNMNKFWKLLAELKNTEAVLYKIHKKYKSESMLRLCAYNSTIEAFGFAGIAISDQTTFDDPVFTLVGEQRLMHPLELKEMYGTVNIPDFVRNDDLFVLLCLKIGITKTISCRAESILREYFSQ